jgi:hypothetical protein
MNGRIRRKHYLLHQGVDRIRLVVLYTWSIRSRRGEICFARMRWKGDTMATDSSEFDSTLETQGTRLCLPLGGTLEEVLERFGFRPDQEVVVRFALDRLEVRPRNTPAEIQERLKHSARDLRQFADRVQAWAAALPALAEEETREATWEDEVLGMLECLLGDNLLPAIHKLESIDELLPPPVGRRAPSGEA